MKLLVKMKFGSHLYGTSTPTSDMDYKGIYIPGADQILTCSIPKTITLSKGSGDQQKNSPDDVDDQLYSLPYFLELALKGETVALDMLHADEEHIIESANGFWNMLHENRDMFYTQNLKAFVGYARRQAAKYGIKGSRLDAAKRAVNALVAFSDKTIGEVYHLLWEDEHSKKYNQVINDLGDELVWEVCGKKMMAKSKCAHYIPMMEKFYQAYGERAKQAEKNEGIDWKAISHALRAGYQARSIFVHRDFTFPLDETPFLISVKKGELDYKTVVAPELDRLMDELEEVAKTSGLPTTPNRAWAMDYLRKVHLYSIQKGF